MTHFNEYGPLYLLGVVVTISAAVGFAIVYVPDPGLVIPAREQVHTWAERIGEAPLGVSCVEKSSYESFCDVRLSTGVVPLRCYTGCGRGCRDAISGECEIRAED